MRAPISGPGGAREHVADPAPGDPTGATLAGSVSPLPRSDVGAVIVTHSRADLAHRCALAVADQVGAGNVVVVVNLPETALRLRSLPCRVVVNQSPCGYGENLNRGARSIGGRHPYLLLLNDDVVPTTGAVDRLVEALERDPAVALAGPTVVDLDGRRTPHSFRFPRLGTTFALAAIPPVRLSGRVPPRWVGISSARDAEWVLGAALLVRAEAFFAIGGFDPGFFLHFEEVDLARRLVDAGWAVRVAPDAVVHHAGHASIGPRLIDETYVDSFSRYVALHWGTGPRLLLPVVLASSRLVNAAIAALGGVIAPRKRRSLAAWRRARRARLPDTRSVRDHAIRRPTSRGPHG